MDLILHLTNNKVLDKDTPRFHLELILPNVVLQISKAQYDNFLYLGKILTASLKEIQEENYKRRYMVYRPLCTIKENRVRWWRYAINCVRRINREMRTRVNQFKLSEDIEKFYQERFMEIFVKEHMKADVSELEKKLYDKLVLIYDQKKIFTWIREGLYQIEKNAQEEKKKNKKGVLGGLFAWGMKKPPEEKKDIQATVKKIFELAMKEVDEVKIEEDKSQFPLMFVGEFTILKSRIKLCSRSMIKEKIEAQFDGISLILKKHYNGFLLSAKMQSIGLIHMSKPSNEIIRLISSSEDKNYLVLSFAFTKTKEITNIKTAFTLVLLYTINRNHLLSYISKQ